MSDIAAELAFQNDMIKHLLAQGWLLGKAEHYNRALALYPEDLIGFVKETQDAQWQKFCQLYPHNTEQKLFERVAEQLKKSDPNAANREMRTFGTLGVLRHELRDRGVRFSLCQFKPEHDLNPDTLTRYAKNRCRVVPELVYSPWASDEHLLETGSKAKAWRIDLVLFVNGLPVATLELKSEFKQAVHNAIHQYKTTRLPIDPVTKKAEPLLTFKRGALVHFAVSQYEVYMATRLEGANTVFLPFNKGTHDGGAGNDAPEDVNQYATDYLWNEVLVPANLLSILGRYVHLQIEEREDWEGRKFRKESLIFPRYHQWDVVNKLINAARSEGPGHKYLIQHSAGSGKSNSIAWVAHQLSSLYDAHGHKRFNSVIVVTDRTVLDAQLQDTINQFEHVDGADTVLADADQLHQILVGRDDGDVPPLRLCRDGVAGDQVVGLIALHLDAGQRKGAGGVANQRKLGFQVFRCGRHNGNSVGNPASIQAQNAMNASHKTEAISGIAV